MGESSIDVPERDAKRVAALCGTPFHIRLWEDRTRGELWVPSYDPARLVLVNEDFFQTASGSAMETGPRVFEFQALVPGRHPLVFEKRMGWKFTAEDRRVFLIDATDGVGPSAPST